ncbi:hypothetical protein D4R86_04850 [bacterium]|nr:MAG: hypothetical protein D4R86_04850 [bacterium]
MEENKEKDEKIVCLICGGPMKLEMYGSTSYFQCEKDATHRMTLTELSDLTQGDRSEDEIRQSMEERAQSLERQEEIHDQINELQHELEILVARSIS